MLYDPVRVAEPAGRTHWPLDANVDVVVSVDTASKDLNDLKVRAPFSEGRLAPPRPGKSPYVTDVHISDYKTKPHRAA